MMEASIVTPLACLRSAVRAVVATTAAAAWTLPHPMAATRALEVSPSCLEVNWVLDKVREKRLKLFLVVKFLLRQKPLFFNILFYFDLSAGCCNVFCIILVKVKFHLPMTWTRVLLQLECLQPYGGSDSNDESPP